MTTESAVGTAAVEREVQPENNSYELFMGVLSIMSIGLMVWMVFVRDPLVQDILVAMDFLFCMIFLIDFGRSFSRAPSKRAYMWPRGIIDLLSSLPGVVATNLAIFRFFRLFRVARVARLLRGKGAKAMAVEFFAHREQTAVYLIVLAVILVITFGSIGEVIFEADAEGANITTAGDAIWWAFVTITTVGYGDQFPVTQYGRVIAVLTMATGIAIFGVVTSILSSFILGGKKEAEEPAESTAGPATAAPVAPPADPLSGEVADLRAEIASLRAALEQRGAAQ